MTICEEAQIEAKRIDKENALEQFRNKEISREVNFAVTYGLCPKCAIELVYTIPLSFGFWKCLDSWLTNMFNSGNINLFCTKCGNVYSQRFW